MPKWMTLVCSFPSAEVKRDAQTKLIQTVRIKLFSYIQFKTHSQPITESGKSSSHLSTTMEQLDSLAHSTTTSRLCVAPITMLSIDSANAVSLTSWPTELSGL